MDQNTTAIRIQGCLPDGAKILKFRPASNDRTFFVLCDWRDEYVSWHVDIDSGDVANGRYSRDLVRAVDTYRERR